MKKIVALLILALAAPAALAGDCETGDSIADLAGATPELSTLVAAVVKADLLQVLDGNRNFTVFAPTNAAFDATAEAELGMGATGLQLVDALPKDMLTDVLLLHVAPGERFSDDVLASERVRTLAKRFVFPSLEGGVPYINDSEIVMPDIDACNGVVHIIDDAVLLPN